MKRPRRVVGLPPVRRGWGAPICLLILVVTGASGCDLPFGVGATEDTSAPPVITELPRALTAGELELMRTTNAFGLDLLQELVEAEPERSHFFSPLSAAMALGMALNGMEGETWEAIRRTLRVPEELSEAEINQSFGGLLDVPRPRQAGGFRGRADRGSDERLDCGEHPWADQ